MPYIDFKAAKQLATMEMLLQRYGVRFNPKPQLHNLPCPLPSHASRDKNSLNVNLERNIWSCKSTSCVSGRNGKEGGNVLDFVMWMESVNAYQAAEKILEWYRTEGPKMQKPPQRTEALAKTESNLDQRNIGEKPRLQVVSRVSSKESADISLIDWLEKSPPESEMVGTRADNPSQPDHTAGGAPVKGHMKEVDVWFDELTTWKEGESEEKFWHRVRNGVKSRLVDSFHAGKRMGRTA